MMFLLSILNEIGDCLLVVEDGVDAAFPIVKVVSGKRAKSGETDVNRGT